MHSRCFSGLGTRNEGLNAAVKAALALALLIPLSLTTASLRGWTDNQCLASALHYEARGEPIEGRRAVLDTITNRMLATGKSACYVIFQRGQFSWVKNKPLLAYGSEQKAMMEEVVGYPTVLSNERYTFFYSGQKPYWAYGMSCKKIKRQTFCKGKEAI